MFAIIETTTKILYVELVSFKNSLKNPNYIHFNAIEWTILYFKVIVRYWLICSL